MTLGLAFAGYCFTRQLQELERRSEGPRSRALPGAEQVVTPLMWERWQEALGDHPDGEWVEFLVTGIKEGFRLGHDQSRVVLQERRGTMYEASQHVEVIRAYLDKELEANRIWKVDEEGVQCSPFGVIPKKGKPGKWRLIVDLSAPEAHSVNDGIDRRLASVAYMSVDDVVRRVLELGPGAKVAKADVRAAYRNVPVHPRDRWLLGMRWDGETFVDGALPFGLRSAPLLFTALGDAVEWVAQRKGAQWIKHYIDDFVMVGRSGTDQCERALAVFKETCEWLGMPLDEGKEEGPSEVLTFLGLEIDTVAMEVRLPQDKLKEFKALVKRWRGMKSCRRRDLESLVGSLNHACKAVRPGRAFKRRLQDLLASVNRNGRRVRLNVEARADVEWWFQFGSRWNGTSLMRSVVAMDEPREEMVSDASGRWGCGAAWSGEWFQIQWESIPGTEEWGIMPKELLPIVVATAVWGRRWSGGSVLARCDNMSVVAAVSAGCCKERRSMHLLRCLAFIEATLAVTVKVVHIRGVDNGVADHLSRGRLQSALSSMQVAEVDPVPIPKVLMELLTAEAHSWSEPEWGRLSRLLSTCP